MPTETSLLLAQQLYIAYYGRPADPAGLEFWARRIDQANGDLTEMIDAFANSEESIALFGTTQTPEERVTVIFQNLLNRAPDPEGLAFYTQALANGTFSPNSLILAVLEAAQNEDATLVANKVAAAENFTNAVSAGNVDYSSAEAAAVARTYLNSITELPSSLASAEAALPAFIAVTQLASTNPQSFAGFISNGVVNDTSIIRENLAIGDLETPAPPAPPAEGGTGGGGSTGGGGGGGGGGIIVSPPSQPPALMDDDNTDFLLLGREVIADGTVRSGSLEFSGDLDAFKVNLEQGKIYRITLENKLDGVEDAIILGIREEATGFLSGGRYTDSLSGLRGAVTAFEGSPSETFIFANKTGVHYIDVRDSSINNLKSNNYSFKIEEVIDTPPPPPEPGPVIQTLVLNEAFDGTIIGPDFEIDRYQFRADRDVRYLAELKWSQDEIPFGEEFIGIDIQGQGLASFAGVTGQGPNNDTYLLSFISKEDTTVGIQVDGDTRGNPGVNNYTLKVSLAPDFEDDHSDFPENATEVNSLGEDVITGVHSIPSELDFFKINLEGGKRYRLDYDQQLAFSSVSVDVYEGLEKAQALQSFGGLFGFEDRSFSYFMAPSDGTYYISTRSFIRTLDDPKAYAVSITEEEIEDDHSDLPSLATTLVDGATTTGKLQFNGDLDYFKLDMSPFTKYEVTITNTANSELENFANFLDVSYTQQGILSYAFSVENDRSVSFTLDSFFENETLIEIRNLSLRDADPADDYTITFRELKDDHGNSNFNATELERKNSTPALAAVEGAIDFSGDVDAFRFDTVAGERYTLTINNLEEGGAGGLFINMFEDEKSEDGQFIFQQFRGSGFIDQGNTSTISFISKAGNSFNFALDSFSFSGFTEPVNYTVALTQAPPAADADGDTGLTATTLMLNNPKTSALDFQGDIDVFKVAVQAGVRYEIGLHEPSLEDGLFNSIGFKLFSGPQLAPSQEITSLYQRFLVDTQSFVAQESGDVYIQVEPNNQFFNFGAVDLGTEYELQIKTVLLDDHGDTNATATKVNLNQIVAGTVNHQSDLDVFEFVGMANKRYIAKIEQLTEDRPLVIDAIGQMTSGAPALGIEYYNRSDTLENGTAFVTFTTSFAGTYHITVGQDFFGPTFDESKYSLVIEEFVPGLTALPPPQEALPLMG